MFYPVGKRGGMVVVVVPPSQVPPSLVGRLRTAQRIEVIFWYPVTRLYSVDDRVASE
jgi:hypothetical protein